MNSLAITIKPLFKNKKIRIEMDAEKFERFAASLGLFRSNFLRSLDKAEKDYSEGKVKKIRSFKDLTQ